MTEWKKLELKITFLTKVLVILKNRENDALTLSHVHKIMNMGLFTEDVMFKKIRFSPFSFGSLRNNSLHSHNNITFMLF
jgi:hypothetical protein